MVERVGVAVLRAAEFAFGGGVVSSSAKAVSGWGVKVRECSRRVTGVCIYRYINMHGDKYSNEHSAASL